MVNKNLHLIEPTLVKLSGHEYSYMANLISVNNFNFNFNIWLNKHAEKIAVIDTLLQINNQIKIHKFFIRSIRQLQKIFLYYKLLKLKQIIYVCTSSLYDLRLCSLLIKLFHFEAKLVFFHFHQFKQNNNKLKILNNINLYAKNNFKILTTTKDLANIFIKANFRLVKQINYPGIINYLENNNFDNNFDKILYAGVARADKGFIKVVDTVEALQVTYPKLNVTVQASIAGAKKDYDIKIIDALQKLKHIAKLNSNIVIYDKALSTKQYQNLFNGAICLLLYDNKVFIDRVSGVFFDALANNAPIITISETFMGDIITKFNAGIVLQLLDLNYYNKIIEAILLVKEQYSYYCNNTKQALQYLKELHHPAHSLQAVYDYL